MANIRSLIWTNVKYYVDVSSTFAKIHPFISFTLLFFVLFYALSPSITFFFIYSLPLLFFFTILLILFFSIPNFKHFDEQRDVDSKIISDKDRDEDAVDNNKNKQKAFLRARSVRQRKSKKCIETGAEEFIQRVTDHDFVDKGALTEEKLKDIREVEVHSISDRRGAEEGSTSSSIFKNPRPDEYSDWSYEGNGKCFKSYSCMFERRREYDGARNKVVQWKDEDQKNFMDLGLSEIERTKRLESLMARRRARKMLSLQVRRSLMNIGCKETFPPISSIIVPKNKEESTSSVSPTPGSAPSVLGPNRNPFDLPYDQHEEKPNVRGGSFMQEFMSAQEQKELMISRHESFGMGAASSSEDLNVDQVREGTLRSDVPSWQEFLEASESSESRHQLGRDDNDRVVEEVPSQASEPERNMAYRGDRSNENLDNRQDENDRSEEQIKSVLVEDISKKTTSSSSSSEDDEPVYKIDKDAILKSIASPALRNLSGGDPSHPGSTFSENTREDEEHLYYPNRPMHHTPGQSIASDLQVEVSEVGSPPLTNSGNSSGGEDISIDGEIEKAIASSNLARVDENELNSREVREVTEQDIVEFGFSRFNISENNGPQNIIPSERTNEPYSTGSRSFPPPRTDRNQASSSSYQQRRPEGLSVFSERFQGSLLQPEFLPQPLPFASTSLVSPTSVLQPNFLIDQGSSSSIDQLQNDRSVHVSSERSDSTASLESDFSLSNLMLQVSELPSETENSVSAKENDVAALVLDSASEPHNENLAFSTIGQGHRSFDTSSTSSSTSVSQPKPPAEVNTGSRELKLKNPIVQSSVPHPETQKSAENSKSLTRHDIQQTVRDNKDEIFSTSSQSIEDSQASSSSPRDSVVEHISIASTSFPSPNLMIQQKFSASEGSSNSEEQNRMQDSLPGIPSERAVNQDSISLLSMIQEVPTASSRSSSPKSALEPKSSTGQGPLLNFDKEEQIDESPNPRMSRNTRTLVADSAAGQRHHADAKMKPSNDDKRKEDLPKMSLNEVSESQAELPNKTTMVSSNDSTKQEKSSDVPKSGTSSSNTNEKEAANHNDDKKKEDLTKMSLNEVSESPAELPNKTNMVCSNESTKQQKSSDVTKSGSSPSNTNEKEATNHNDDKKKEALPNTSLKEVSESHTELPDKTTMVSSNNSRKQEKPSDVAKPGSSSSSTNENLVTRISGSEETSGKGKAEQKPSNDKEKSHEESTNDSDDKKKEDLLKMNLKEVSESHAESPNKTTMVSSNNSTRQQKSSDVAKSGSSLSNTNEKEAANHNDDNKKKDLPNMSLKEVSESHAESPNKTTMVSSNDSTKQQKSSDVVKSGSSSSNTNEKEATNHNDDDKKKDFPIMSLKEVSESPAELPNKTTMVSSNDSTKQEKSSDVTKSGSSSSNTNEKEVTNHNDDKKKEDLTKMSLNEVSESHTESPNKTTMVCSNNSTKQEKSSDVAKSGSSLSNTNEKEATNHNDDTKKKDLPNMSLKEVSESPAELPNKTTVVSSNNITKQQKSSDVAKSGSSSSNTNEKEATNHNDDKKKKDLPKMSLNEVSESQAELPNKTSMLSSNDSTKQEKSSDVAKSGSSSSNTNENEATNHNDDKKKEDLPKMSLKEVSESHTESPNKTTMVSSNNSTKQEKSSDVPKSGSSSSNINEKEAANHKDDKKKEDLPKMSLDKVSESHAESPNKTTMVCSNDSTKQQKSSDVTKSGSSSSNTNEKEATNHNDDKKKKDLPKMSLNEVSESQAELPNKTSMLSSNDSTKQEKSSDVAKSGSSSSNTNENEATNHNDDKKKEDLPKMSLKEVSESHTESPNKTTMVSSNNSTKQEKSSDVPKSGSSSSNINEKEAANHKDDKKKEDLPKMSLDKVSESHAESPNKTTMVCSNDSTKQQKSSDVTKSGSSSSNTNEKEATNHNDDKKKKDLLKMSLNEVFESQAELPNKTSMLSSNDSTKQQKSSDVAKTGSSSSNTNEKEATNHNDDKKKEDLTKMSLKEVSESQSELPNKTSMLSSNDSTKQEKSSDVAKSGSSSSNTNENIVTRISRSEETSEKCNAAAAKES